MTSEASFLGWVLAGIAGIISSLTGALAYIFRLRESENAKRIEAGEQRISNLEVKLEESDKRATDCERDRAEIRAEMRATCAANACEIERLKNEIDRINKDGTEFSHRVTKKT